MKQEFNDRVLSSRDYVDLAQRKRRSGSVDEAHRTLMDGLEKYPHSASIYVGLGNLHRDTRRDNEALYHFDMAYKLAPYKQKTIMAYANFLSVKHKYDEAEMLYARLFCLNKENDDVRLLCAIGNVYQRSGQPAYAAACFGMANSLPKADEYAQRRYDEVKNTFHVRFNDKTWQALETRLRALGRQSLDATPPDPAAQAGKADLTV